MVQTKPTSTKHCAQRNELNFSSNNNIKKTYETLRARSHDKTSDDWYDLTPVLVVKTFMISNMKLLNFSKNLRYYKTIKNTFYFPLFLTCFLTYFSTVYLAYWSSYFDCSPGRFTKPQALGASTAATSKGLAEKCLWQSKRDGKDWDCLKVRNGNPSQTVTIGVPVMAV